MTCTICIVILFVGQNPGCIGRSLLQRDNPIKKKKKKKKKMPKSHRYGQSIQLTGNLLVGLSRVLMFLICSGVPVDGYGTHQKFMITKADTNIYQVS